MSLASPTILCIEDNPVNWRLVQRLLSQTGARMHWAEEGLQGYELALSLKPDLILLDINLPGLSGFEVATKIRQNPELAGVPIVALTAKTQRVDRDTALVAGCDGFIGKPIDPFQFAAQVGAYLHGRRDRIEESREGPALRNFSQQVVERLEAQLREAEASNRKLQDTQVALESRNRSLSRLLDLSRAVLSRHDPGDLLLEILRALREELGLVHASGYWADPGGGYLAGFRWNGADFEPLAALPTGSLLPTRLNASLARAPVSGEDLVHSPYWNEGLALGLWSQPSSACLVPLRDRRAEEHLWGFLALARGAGEAFLPSESELIDLHAGMALVGLENAELITSLNESSRALGESYERLETAYQEIQVARRALGQQERQAVLGELFLNIAKRLGRPVEEVQRDAAALERALGPEDAPGSPAAVAIQGIRSAAVQMESLIRALLRRAGQAAPPTPEWLSLHDLILQELELLGAEGTLPAGLEIRSQLEARDRVLFGVYADFAEIFGNLVAHATGGPTPGGILLLRTWSQDGRFHLQLTDDSGPIIPELLEKAFEPFAGLRGEEPVRGVRKPGEGLPAAAQGLAAYQGRISLGNEGEGTALEVELPLH